MERIFQCNDEQIYSHTRKQKPSVLSYIPSQPMAMNSLDFSVIGGLAIISFNLRPLFISNTEWLERFTGQRYFDVNIFFWIFLSILSGTVFKKKCSLLSFGSKCNNVHTERINSKQVICNVLYHYKTVRYASALCTLRCGCISIFHLHLHVHGVSRRQLKRNSNKASVFR